MKVTARLELLESRVAHLEKIAAGATAKNDRAALDAMKRDMRNRAPELRTDAQRIIANLRKAGERLDAALAKAAEQDALRYTPPALAKRMPATVAARSEVRP
jgi:hypothetical protein